MFKKTVFLLGLFLGLISFNSGANDTSPIQTIKLLYSHSMQMNKHIHGFDDNELLSKFSTPELRKLFNADDKYMTKTGGLACIEYNVMWQSNGSSSDGDVFMEEINDNYIRVIIDSEEVDGLEARDLIYEMNCTADKCQVNDIWEGGKSFKKQMTECLKDLKAL